MSSLATLAALLGLRDSRRLIAQINDRRPTSSTYILARSRAKKRYA